MLLSCMCCIAHDTILHQGGLIAAMDRMKNELMLLGVATLILLSFEQDIQRICGAPQTFLLNQAPTTTAWGPSFSSRLRLLVHITQLLARVSQATLGLDLKTVALPAMPSGS